jgi:hypothetical protein
MNLKKLLTSQKKVPQQEHFLALEIHESLIKTAVWKIEEAESVISSLGSFELWDSEESLINGVDASLSAATKGLLEKPTKVILGLPEPWLEGDKIHPTKTKLIKHVLTELGLKPIGLVTSTQAIIHHLKKKEGIPPSAVLLEVYPDKVTVAVVKLGKVEALEEVGRSGELNKDVQEGLTRLNLDQLPPRFVLTNGSNLDEEQQQLLSYPWQDKLPFLHLPKVEVLPTEFSIEAIALAGGLEAADSLGIVSEEVVSPKPTPISNPSDNLSSLGFHVEDSKQTVATDQPEVPKIPEIPETPETPEVISEPVIIKEPKPSLSKTTRPNPFKSIGSFFKTKSAGFNKKSGLVIASGLLLIPIFLTIAYLALASAQVTISVKETSLSETVDINFGGEANSNGLNLPVKTESLTASVSESISTTGEALVGDKAVGTIVLFNRTNSPIVVKSGTRIESDNLIYTINSSDTVASKSADLSDPFNPVEKPGKLDNVSVTATGIGTRYNVSKSTQFSVGAHSRTVIYAVGEGDFSGGSSRTVKAVSEDDQQKLLEAATQKVISQIDSKVKKQDPNLSSLVIGKLSYTKKDFSKDVKEEADSVSLELIGEVKVLLYSDSDIINQLTAQLIPKISSNMMLLPDKTTIEVLPPQEDESDSDVYKTQANIKGLLIPVIDQDRYVSQLKGKSVKKLKNILETIPGYESTKIVIKPNFPFLSNYIPLNKQKVSLTITTSK